MKAILKFTLTMAFMFTTVVGMAKGPKLYVIGAKNAQSLVFTLEKENNGAFIKFMDAKNNVIYAERIKDQKDYTKKFVGNMRYNTIFSFT